MNRGGKYTVDGLEAWGKEGERHNNSKDKLQMLQMLVWEALAGWSPACQTQLYTGENTGLPTAVLFFFRLYLFI